MWDVCHLFLHGRACLLGLPSRSLVLLITKIRHRVALSLSSSVRVLRLLWLDGWTGILTVTMLVATAIEIR